MTSSLWGKEMAKEIETLNLFEFGNNENGSYVNLVEEEKRKADISKAELLDFVNNYLDPFIKVIYNIFFFERKLDSKAAILTDIKNELEEIYEKHKVYHYAKFNKGIYVFSITYDERLYIIFENQEHYLIFEGKTQEWDLENRKWIPVTIEDYLLSKQSICFPACHTKIFDTKTGEQITKFAGEERYAEDIRHIVIMKEWQMDKFSKNRLHEGKKIKDFYEVEFYWDDFQKFYGESEKSETDQ